MTLTLLNSAPVVIFSKNGCPFCDMAKSALKPIVPADKVKIFELDEIDTESSIQNSLHKYSGISTVPQVFVNGKFLGDGTTISKLGESSKLRKILEEQGVL